MDRGAWWATVHGAAKSWTRLSDYQFHQQYVRMSVSLHLFLYPCQSNWLKKALSHIKCISVITEWSNLPLKINIEKHIQRMEQEPPQLHPPTKEMKWHTLSVSIISKLWKLSKACYNLKSNYLRKTAELGENSEFCGILTGAIPTPLPSSTVVLKINKSPSLSSYKKQQ